MTSYLDTYMDGLRRKSAERNAKRQAEAATNVVDPLAALKERIRDWYGTLPPDGRSQFYFMADLQRLLNASPQALGMALASLGWQRRRVWKKGQSFRQRWYAPPEWQDVGGNDSE